MSVKNWNSSYKGGHKQKIKQHILDSISLWVAIGLLWFSFVSIIGEHFPEFLEAEVLVPNQQDLLSSTIYYGPIFTTVYMEWWWIVFLVVLLFVGFEWPSQYLKKLATACQVIGTALPVVYIVSRLEAVANGIVYIVNIYLPYLNEYYGTHFSLAMQGEQENGVVAFTAICMVFWSLIWLIAYGWKKRIFMVLFPVIALGLELAVGLSPHGNGLLYALFAALLLLLLGEGIVWKKAAVLACVWISVLFVGIGFKANVENLTTESKKQWLLNAQKNFDLRKLSLFQLDLHANSEKLNNVSPTYTGEVILEIEADMLPVDTVYLKGFYGTRYEDGMWVYDDSAFLQACKDAGRKPEEVAKQIFQMPYERTLEFERQSNMAKYINYNVFYTGTTGNVVYVPYLSNYSTADAGYTFMGDYLLKKSVLDNRVEIEALNSIHNLERWRVINACIQMAYGDITSLGLSGGWYEEIYLSDQEEELAFLNGFLENYLELPEDTAYLDHVVEYMDGILFYDDYKQAVQMDGENYRRIVCAEMVANYLDMYMEYSLILDNIPEDVDPIAYALNTSREGYCMHFASIATLALRKAGVPARYVSGYTIRPYAFVREEGTETFKAKVEDYMAHAWVEIYLDNIGWIPVEVTPGSSLTSRPTPMQMNQWEQKSNRNRELWELNDTQDGPFQTDDSETETQDLETETQDSQTEETEDDTQVQQDTQNDQQDRPGDLSSYVDIGKQNLRLIVIFCVLVGTGMVVFFSVKHGKNRYEAALTQELEKGLTRRGVKRMNRRLYYMLRLSRPVNWFKTNWSDMEYRNALVEQFEAVTEEEWDVYMEIVKKNHYSHATISVEEMNYCYKCYKKVKLFNFKRKEKK